MTTLHATITKSTIKGGKVAHVGQIYFDQDLNDLTFQVHPYRANDQIRLRNQDDYLVMQGSGGGADPIAHYILLGDDLKDGVFAWINFAIDPNEKKKVNALADCSEGKCKQHKQWWLEKLVLRIIMSPNVYWRKPPIIEASKEDVAVAGQEGRMLVDENSAPKKEL
jgi:hypothetical protein